MYDVIIIGAGFAGYTAAIYTARYNLKTLVIGKELGGMIVESVEVCNYPGFEKISGAELMSKFMEHAKAVGAEVVADEILKVINTKKGFKIETRQKKEYESKTLIVATGTKRRKLEVPGGLEFESKGIHYCATCDGAFYRNKSVAVIGGSNSAAHSALLLSRFAKKVYIIYRKEEMRCEPVLLEKIRQSKNIEIICNANVKEVKGSKFVERVMLDKPYNKKSELDVDGVFVELGGVPNSVIAKELGLEVNEQGEVIVNASCETSIKGVFAAGDVINTPMRQGIVAAGQGAIAAGSAYQHLTGKTGWS
ncbi:MAG TPA: FAD-dependent oxidoreductase [Candidatus Nanoarchaeia archaeon]|nr:FAD-dependent oxidoreductase [Candidatus Nanoarchaeia archaeon]